jgi:hypothetical protein
VLEHVEAKAMDAVRDKKIKRKIGIKKFFVVILMLQHSFLLTHRV